MGGQLAKRRSDAARLPGFVARQSKLPDRTQVVGPKLQSQDPKLGTPPALLTGPRSWVNLRRRPWIGRLRDRAQELDYACRVPLDAPRRSSPSLRLNFLYSYDVARHSATWSRIS